MFSSIEMHRYQDLFGLVSCTQFLGVAHKGRVCIYPFIEVSVYTFFLSKHSIDTYKYVHTLTLMNTRTHILPYEIF
jgi:hypothetical protein